MHVWALGLSCEAPAASKPPGFHTTTREPKRADLRVPIFTKPPKFYEKTPRERQKRAKIGRRERNFWRSGGGRSGRVVRRGARRKVGRTHNTQQGIFSYTPEPHIAFCPIFVHSLFPVFEPMFENGSFLSVVALVSVTLLDSNPRPSAGKRSNLAPTPSSSLTRTTTIELPECQEPRGAKTT